MVAETISSARSGSKVTVRALPRRASFSWFSGPVVLMVTVSPILGMPSWLAKSSTRTPRIMPLPPLSSVGIWMTASWML